MGDLYLETSAGSELARARFTLGLLALHNFWYELAKEEFQKAYDEEQKACGKPFPLAMWGAAMATTMILWQYGDCEEGGKYLKKIPSELPSWLTDLERELIATGFELYPLHFKNCKVILYLYKNKCDESFIE